MAKFGTQNRKIWLCSTEVLLEPSLNQCSESILLLCAFSDRERKMNRFFFQLWCMCRAGTARDKRPKPAV